MRYYTGIFTGDPSDTGLVQGKEYRFSVEDLSFWEILFHRVLFVINITGNVSLVVRSIDSFFRDWDSIKKV